MDLRRIRDQIYLIWIARQITKFHRRGGRVVVITGSYGKTSVKELVADLLRHKYQTLATSGNYNTVVGIAKTLRYEMTKNTQLLILEVGAYHTGEIEEFCHILRPDVGVITGIAKQHLERFGSWKKIIQAKTEIMKYIKRYGGVLVANGSDETVVRVVEGAKWYKGIGLVKINQNAAKLIASVCGMSEEEIKRNQKYFRVVPSRFELTETRYGMKVIDDSYNSNEKSFVEAVKHLGKQKQYTRILVTPGVVELGAESQRIHEVLGKGIVGNADIVILVGDNERTHSLAQGMGGKVKVYQITKTLEFMQLVKGLKLAKDPLVLIENDVPENYE